MGKLVTDQTAQEILQTIETVKNLSRPTTTPKRRNVRGSGAGGAGAVYVEITASTNISTYTATIYDNPVDRNSIEVGITVRAMQHDSGTIPNSAVGKGFLAVKLGDTYFLNNYSVFYGG